MIVTPLTVDRIPDVEKLLALGEPYIRLRGSSDYWLYTKLSANTCPLAIMEGLVVGCVIAFRSQVPLVASSGLRTVFRIMVWSAGGCHAVR
ncbi:hypothetical protein ACTMS0_28470 [Micromonospora sp. H33]|uniref:hypothetical protein n=1 Tax=Micromonospora sp. H33 TaxID=3452215 RepID=UPI003F8A17E7